MQQKFGFSLYTLAEFEQWIAKTPVFRSVLYVQQHHTWSPQYVHFNGRNHFELQRGMQNHHRNNNGWTDIGQHFTIFPDGLIASGRSLESSPACIYGFNAHAICLEHLGNFDVGGDTMRPEQRNAIIRVTAALCKRFNIPPIANRVVYHHWFDLRTGARTGGSGATKSCPGTAFFGGNKVVDAEKYFFPLVKAAIAGEPIALPPKVQYGYVTSWRLNVRNQPSASGQTLQVTPFGSVLRIYEEKNGWYRISAAHQEWVSARFVQNVQRATVNTDALNVRSGPSTDFNKVAALKKGEEVFIYEENGAWARVSLEARWVSKRYLDIRP
jgi:uncharacterized protein YgiM (DUF1202 family)